ncbi:MAG: hypothetical protein ACRDXX_21980 [Stackebrandtia sp.]
MSKRSFRATAVAAFTVVAAAAATLGVGHFSVAEAEDGAPEFRYQVTRNAGPYVDVPGLSVDVHAAEGESTYLWARNLTVENVTSLAAGDNIGTTVAIICRNADGSELEGERGTYWAANLVPPDEKELKPTLRWLFTPPEAGDYTCSVAITSYSSIIVDGREVEMRVPAGAELASRVYPASQRWTLPQESERVVDAGDSVTTLGYTYKLAADEPKLAVVQDLNLTTCKYGSSICDGGSPDHDGTQVSTQVTAQPQNADGSECAPELTSEEASRFISTPKHHLSSTNTLYIDRDQLGDCAQLRVSLRLTNVEGNPVIIHAGYSTELARTHGVAFEY